MTETSQGYVCLQWFGDHFFEQAIYFNKYINIVGIADFKEITEKNNLINKYCPRKVWFLIVPTSSSFFSGKDAAMQLRNII